MEILFLRKRYFFFLLLYIFSSSKIYALEEREEANFSSSSAPKSQVFKFSELSHEDGDPESYTLVCFDATLIPHSKKAQDLTHRKEFNPVKDWIRLELLEEIDEEKGSIKKTQNKEESGAEEESNDSSSEESDQPKKSYPRKRILSLKSGKVEETSYYVVSLSLESSATTAENFTKRLLKEKGLNQKRNQYRSSMIIFPQEKSPLVLAYVFGKWSQLLNPYAIIPDWGLRVAASKDIFSERSVKALGRKESALSNPTSRTETKHRLAPFEDFDCEIGTDGLEGLTFLPQYAEGTSCERLAKAKEEWFKFFLPSCEEDEEKGDTLGSLVHMVSYFYTVSHPFKIHERLQRYIDEEVSDGKILEGLIKHFLGTLKRNPKFILLPSQYIWRSYGTRPSFSYGKNQDQKYLWQALEGEDFNLDSLVSIKKSRRKEIYEEPLYVLMSSLPIEWQREFYRFDRGRWFRIAASRFNLIIDLMRDPRIKTRMETLPPYTLEDALGEGGGGLYQEDCYNRRVIASLPKGKQKGLLLDRLNIYLGGRGNQFEFGDILLYGSDKKYYIVHVKRRESDAMDHHRAQVERSAEYLATELRKENAETLLLRGCVKGVYLKHGIEANKEKKQGKRLTHSAYFEDRFKEKKKGKKKSWKNYLRDSIFHNTQEEASTFLGQLKILLRTIDFDFFENHQKELIVALDALRDCAEKKKLSKEDVEDFLAAIKQLICIKEVLFPSGILKEETRKNIVLVMAVIDDRRIEPIRKAIQEVEKEKKKEEENKEKRKESSLEKKKQELEDLKKKDRKKEESLFKKQHLWGLNRTRQLVQKLGFQFNLVVINENEERGNWDAFGEVKDKKPDSKDGLHEDKKDAPEHALDEESSGTEDADLKSKKRKKTSKKKEPPKKAQKDDDEDQEDKITSLSKRLKKFEKSDDIDLYFPQKFTFNGLLNPAEGIFGEYISCPTEGDGNCFFHAASTQDGEDSETVAVRAAVMRSAFCDMIQGGAYLGECRNLLYEDYLSLLGTSHEKDIPGHVRALFQQDSEHVAARNYALSRGIAKEHLSPYLSSEHLYDADTIKGAILDTDVKFYMERLRINNGEESYIPLRPDMTCPVELLARENNLNINVFALQKEEGKATGFLRLLKRAGNVQGVMPINILIEGVHYVALINSGEPEERKKAVLQIMRNAGYAFNGF
ncbi:MAG: hypothetical protein JSS34_06705 [Proteobacteria bacterium]|nr:hypothetical protein [Pseudomonadota bacterium]